MVYILKVQGHRVTISGSLCVLAPFLADEYEKLGVLWACVPLNVCITIKIFIMYIVNIT